MRGVSTLGGGYVKSLLCVLAVTVLVVAGSAAAVGQTLVKTEVTGYANYVLGADQKTVLAANPWLKPGAEPFTRSVPVTSYSGEIAMGGPSPTLILHFWNGKLAAIHLEWAPSLFKTRSELSVHIGSTAQLLLQAYDPSLVKNKLIYGDDVIIGIVDARGNAVAMLGGDTLGISLTYTWGVFRRAVQDAPPAPSTF